MAQTDKAAPDWERIEADYRAEVRGEDPASVGLAVSLTINRSVFAHIEFLLGREPANRFFDYAE